jgi:hypothetical protein
MPFSVRVRPPLDGRVQRDVAEIAVEPFRAELRKIHPKPIAPPDLTSAPTAGKKNEGINAIEKKNSRRREGGTFFPK